MYEAIAALAADFRDVVVAGPSYGEAAKALRIPEGTVMSRLHRGRQQIVRFLGPGPA